MSYIVKNLDIQNMILANPELFSNRKLPVKVIYWLSRLERELQRNFKIFNEEKTKLLEDHCLKNADGKPKITGGQYDFGDETIKAKAIQAVNELLGEETEINIDKIKIEIDKLQDAISANEMVLLEPFIEFIEEE